jgi:hypothetical protein
MNLSYINAFNGTIVYKATQLEGSYIVLPM